MITITSGLLYYMIQNHIKLSTKNCSSCKMIEQNTNTLYIPKLNRISNLFKYLYNIKKGVHLVVIPFIWSIFTKMKKKCILL